MLTAKRLAPSWFIAVALLSALALTACGGGGEDDDDDIDLISATAVVGQADYTSGSANRGGVVSELGVAQPLGGIATNGQLFYLADYANHRVLGYNSIPTGQGAAANFVLGQDAFTTNSPGSGATQLALPTSVAVANGKLVVSDPGNNRVLIWNSLPTGNVMPDVVLGQTDLNGNEAGLAADKLSFPVAAVIANNRLLVADQNNNRVLIWNTVPTASGTPADVVLGQSDFTSNKADDEEDGLNQPSSIWSDGFRLLISDTGNNRVMYWTQIPRSNKADASYVIGQTDFSRVSAGVSSSSLRTPYGVTSDGTRIYVADSGNNRVLKFDSFPISNGQAATDIYGQDRDSFSNRLPNDDDQDGDTDDTPSARTLSTPTGVSTFNALLYVVDRNNHRVLAFPG